MNFLQRSPDMTTKSSTLKLAIKAARKAMGPQRYGTAENPLSCVLCRNDRFKVGRYIPIMMMHTIVCAKCNRVEFFETMPPLVEDGAGK